MKERGESIDLFFESFDSVEVAVAERIDRAGSLGVGDDELEEFLSAEGARTGFSSIFK